MLGGLTDLIPGRVGAVLGRASAGASAAAMGGNPQAAIERWENRRQQQQEEALFASTIKEMRDQKIDPLSQSGFNLLIDKGLITTPGDFFKYHELAKKDDKALAEMIKTAGSPTTPDIYREAVEGKIGQKITSPALEEARSKTRVQLATEGSEIRSKKAAAAQAEAKAPLNKEIFVEAVQRLYPNLDLNNPHIRDYILPRASEMASSYLNTVDPNTGKVTPNIDMDIDSAITAALAQLKVVPDANTDRSWLPFSGAGAPEAGTGNVAQQYQPKQVGQSPDGNPIVDLGGGKQEEMIPMVSPDGKNKLVPASKYYYFVKTLKFKDRK